MLKLPRKLVPDFSAMYRNIRIDGEWVTIRIMTVDEAIEMHSSRCLHRVYVVCRCGRDISIARWNLHKCDFKK
jgi:hypothetical protein